MVTNSGTTGASYHDENTGKFTPSGSDWEKAQKLYKGESVSNPNKQYKDQEVGPGWKDVKKALRTEESSHISNAKNYKAQQDAKKILKEHSFTDQGKGKYIEDRYGYDDYESDFPAINSNSERKKGLSKMNIEDKEYDDFMDAIRYGDDETIDKHIRSYNANKLNQVSDTQKLGWSDKDFNKKYPALSGLGDDAAFRDLRYYATATGYTPDELEKQIGIIKQRDPYITSTNLISSLRKNIFDNESGISTNNRLNKLSSDLKKKGLFSEYAAPDKEISRVMRDAADRAGVSLDAFMDYIGSAGLDISGGIGGEPGAKMSEDRFRYWLNDIAEYIKNSRQ